MTRVYPAIVNWREQKVETCPRRSPSFENFLGKQNSLDNFFSLHTTTVLNIPITSSSFLDALWFASLCWWPLFSLFSGASMYFLLALLLARYSPFNFMPFLVLFRVPLAVFCPFWRPYSISCAIFSTRFTPFTC